MRRYWHELRHHLLTVVTLVCLVVLLLVGVTGGYTSSRTPLAEAPMVYYYSAGYHFIVFAGDIRGIAVPDASVTVWINSTGPTPIPLGQVHGLTGLDGLAKLVVALAEGNYTFGEEVSAGGASVGQSGLNLVNPTPAEPVLGGFSSMEVGFLTTSPLLTAMWASPNGGTPSGYQARYVFVSNSTSAPVLSLPPSQTTFLGTLSGYETNFPCPRPENATPESWTVVFIYAPNGTEMKSQDFYAFQLPPSAVSSDGNLALDFLASVQPLVALLSLLVAYARYGKDRSLRTLESVLWRPVTRSGLILVRLASALIVLVAGIALLVGAVDIAALLTFGSGFPVGVFLGILGVLTAEATAFVGLAFLGAHLLRSRGSLVGFVVGVFLFFLVIFPGVVTTLMLALQLSPGSSPSLQFQLNASYFDPIQLLHSAMIALVPGWFSLGSSFGPVGPGIASVVVSIPALVLSSAAWSGAPSIAAFYLARFRD